MRDTVVGDNEILPGRVVNSERPLILANWGRGNTGVIPLPILPLGDGDVNESLNVNFDWHVEETIVSLLSSELLEKVFGPSIVLVTPWTVVLLDTPRVPDLNQPMLLAVRVSNGSCRNHGVSVPIDDVVPASHAASGHDIVLLLSFNDEIEEFVS